MNDNRANRITGCEIVGDVATDAVGEVGDGDDPDTVGEAMGEVAVESVVSRMDAGIRGQTHPGYTGNTAGTTRTLEDTAHLKTHITAKVVMS